jgi:hypothetical protein
MSHVKMCELKWKVVIIMVNAEEGSKRRFALRNPDGSESSIFTGKSPRQAALKAANKVGGTKEKPIVIKLREHGTQKLHVFNGYKMEVDAPENGPAWLKGKINKAFVEKVKVEKIEK